MSDFTECAMKAVIILLCLLTDQTLGKNISTFSKFDYCLVECADVKHTMCEFVPGGGDLCPNNEKVYLDNVEKKWILEQHNNIRQMVALGRETRGLDGTGQPPASNMKRMAWDAELAAIAKRWADQCREGLHDVCRVTMDGWSVGQNSYIGKYPTGSGTDTIQARSQRLGDVIKAWHGEARLMDGSLVRRYLPEEARGTTNYTQLVWANSGWLGCAYTEFKMINRKTMYRFVCNYRMAGNKPQESVYREGKFCTSCPTRSTCSETWPGLCFDGSQSQFNDVANVGTQHSGGTPLSVPAASIAIIGLTLVFFCLQQTN